MNWKEKETLLKALFVNKKLTDIEFFNINDNYFVFDEEAKWVIDGGIQIQLGESVFNFGWNEENQGVDYTLNETIEKQFGELPFYSLNAKKINGIVALMGKEISDVSFKWQFYQEYDENYELKEEKIYTPVEVLIKFNSNEVLQLAVINFQIKKDPFEIVNSVYDLNGQLLISLNSISEILDPLEESNK